MEEEGNIWKTKVEVEYIHPYLKWGANLLSWVVECTKCKCFMGLGSPVCQLSNRHKQLIEVN